MREPIKVKNINHLIKLITINGENEYFYCLSNKPRFSRWIDYDTKTKKFFIQRDIEDKGIELTHAKILNRKYSDIGTALSLEILFAYNL